jgi:hypothetical protein
MVRGGKLNRTPSGSRLPATRIEAGFQAAMPEEERLQQVTRPACRFRMQGFP